ncbi:urease accessory protein UreD [Sedimenticola hydrogenitrophicus]|uniref:urease accessory protein UreD n=1 Tax=Sedimenticola hydrogenitrophicus TaxID=2967975 RepID=UPI0023B130D0|nr:urease accessory protein UreD [Sedimenticola hydrogenitrophicus]
MAEPAIRSDAMESTGWQAALRLGFRQIAGKTLLAERSRQGPLAVQRALYPEGDLCHVYLLHPPGGVAGGDQLRISTEVAPGATALVTTPGATKFYRSAGPWATQRQTLRVTDGCLEWLPQENIIFPGARIELATTVQLEGNARFIGWEIHCLGRPVIDEVFDHGAALFRFSLFRDGLPLLHERLEVNGQADLGASAGLRHHPVLGTLIATTGATAGDNGLLDTIRAQLPESQRNRLGITEVDGLFIARYLGDSTETARALFSDIWKALRPAVVDRPPCVPRIWNT